MNPEQQDSHRVREFTQAFIINILFGELMLARLVRRSFEERRFITPRELAVIEGGDTYTGPSMVGLESAIIVLSAVDVVVARAVAQWLIEFLSSNIH